jgi:hypothetical protein
MRWIYLAIKFLVAARTNYILCRIWRSSPCPSSDLMPICGSRRWSTSSDLPGYGDGGTVCSRSCVDHTKGRDVALWARPELGVASSPTEDDDDRRNSARTSSGGLCFAGRRFPRRLHLGRSRSADRGAVAAVKAISGTSASAMNAALMADGWMQGGAEGARAALDAYCHVGIARRQPSRSFRIIVERVSFDQRRITQ